MAEAVARDLRFVARFLALRFGIVPGLYSKTQPREEQDNAALCVGVILASRGAAVLRPCEKAYFSIIVRPAFRLSKFRIVFRTSEYVPRVSPR